ncbi:MAG: tRNA (N6-threonylcarbamoyladenosine(37)-N6)-methyltransferase TrmO [Clostridia bacterium]|nr:tRNA (N6-threonylcarbamoyladenosine(37)-N6)-methyltransferase TrmO [Clostridia bacterium]
MEPLTLTPVAVYHCGFPTKFGLPRQSGLAPDLHGEIVFLPPFRNPDFLRGIEAFSHLWLLWRFNEAPSVSPTVRPPKLGGNKRVGVFASRSPFRPNPLGLSCVKLEGVTDTAQGKVLRVSGGDLMDGTVIFDVKPYLPYADAHPDATGGYAVPGDAARLKVVIPPELEAAIPADGLSALTEALAQDPRPGYQTDPDRTYYLPYAGFDVGFTVCGGTVTVTEIKELNQAIDARPSYD